MFAITSRYYGVETASLPAGENRFIVYLRRRFLPQPDQLALVQEHIVVEGERLDNVTAKYLNDPEQFWRVADANRAMQPEELTATPGRRIRITLPQGFPGSTA